MDCPYVSGCSKVYKKFSEGASGELEKGILSALSAHYAPCKKNGIFPNKGFVQETANHSYNAGGLLCFSGFKITEMDDAPKLAEV